MVVVLGSESIGLRGFGCRGLMGVYGIWVTSRWVIRVCLDFVSYKCKGLGLQVQDDVMMYQVNALGCTRIINEQWVHLRALGTPPLTRKDGVMRPHETLSRKASCIRPATQTVNLTQ